MEIRKSSIEQAKADFNEIKDFAMKQAMKEVESKLTPKLDEIINSALNESTSIEAGEVKIEVPGDENITISKEDGSSVTIGGSEGAGEDNSDAVVDPIDPIIPDETEISSDNSEENEEEDGIEVDMDGDGEGDEDEEFMVDDSEEESENNEETIEEAEDTIEDPQADQNQDNNMTQETPKEMENPFEAIMQRLDSIESKLEGGAEASTEDSVEIVDDETASAAPAAEVPAEPVIDDAAAAPAEPAATPEEDPNAPVQEEFVLEGGDEEFEFDLEDESGSVNPSDYSGLDEEEVVAEIIDDESSINMEEEESLEEMLGVSHAVKHRADKRDELNENKQAQYESTIDELLKENASLKEEIKDFQNSFIELRRQFNEMQTFNTKLAYTNKIFINGGLSQEEKERIAEQFDQTKTMEEAKDLFKKIMKESTNVPTKKNAEEKIKSKTISNNSNPQPLYESERVKRWKQLGGIEKISDEE